MHLYLYMRAIREKAALPVHYNYLVQSLIYSALPPPLASYFHEHGYKVGQRNFKLFSFSRLMGKFKIDKEAKTISFPGNVRLVISSPEEDFIEGLAESFLKKKYVDLGEACFEVEKLHVKQYNPAGDKIVVKTLSPVVTYNTLFKPEGGKYTCYFQPGESEFNSLVADNLRKKFNAFYNLEHRGNVSIEPLNSPRLHITKYKGIIIKGYTCRLKLEGPRDLLQLGVDAGLGSKGSQGFGCVEKDSKSN